MLQFYEGGDYDYDHYGDEEPVNQQQDHHKEESKKSPNSNMPSEENKDKVSKDNNITSNSNKTNKSDTENKDTSESKEAEKNTADSSEFDCLRICAKDAEMYAATIQLKFRDPKQALIAFCKSVYYCVPIFEFKCINNLWSGTVNIDGKIIKCPDSRARKKDAEVQGCKYILEQIGLAHSLDSYFIDTTR